MPNMNKQQMDAANKARELMKQNLARLEVKPVERPVEIEQARVAAQRPEPVVEEAPAEQFEEAVEPTAAEIAAEMEQRWKSADGMLKQQGAEFRRIKAEMEAAKKAAEDEARAVKAELERVQAEMHRSRPVSTDELKKYFTTEQIERYGEDEAREILQRMRLMAEDATSITRKAVQNEVSGAVEELRAEKQNLTQLRQEQFWNTVDSLLPEWREIDVKPEFMSWLEEVDPMSGHLRRDLGVNARDSLDAKRFVAIYNAFKNTQAKSTSVASPKRLLPNGVPSASTPTSSPKQTPVSMQEINDYKSKQARGYYKSRPKELERDRARILSALPQRA